LSNWWFRAEVKSHQSLWALYRVVRHIGDVRLPFHLTKPQSCCHLGESLICHLHKSPILVVRPASAARNLHTQTNWDSESPRKNFRPCFFGSIILCLRGCTGNSPLFHNWTDLIASRCFLRDNRNFGILQLATE
jgi:hypothetical protein